MAEMKMWCIAFIFAFPSLFLADELEGDESCALQVAQSRELDRRAMNCIENGLACNLLDAWHFCRSNACECEIGVTEGKCVPGYQPSTNLTTGPPPAPDVPVAQDLPPSSTSVLKTPGSPP